MSGWVLRKNLGYPPDDALALGNQTDGAGLLYLAVPNNTQWGTLPAKAKQNTCWYSYDGEELYTDDFSWVCAKTGTVNVVMSDGSSPPKNAIISGYQTDGVGDLHTALAIGDHGTVPGKANGDLCWYPYNGKEIKTGQFFGVTASSNNVAKSTFKPNLGSPPSDTIMLGYQYDGAGHLYLGVANSQWGSIFPEKLRMGPVSTHVEGKSMRRVTSLGRAQILIRTFCMLTMDMVLQSMV